LRFRRGGGLRLAAVLGDLGIRLAVFPRSKVTEGRLHNPAGIAATADQRQHDGSDEQALAAAPLCFLDASEWLFSQSPKRGHTVVLQGIKGFLLLSERIRDAKFSVF